MFFISPAALILYAYAAEKQLHWAALVVAVGLFQFGKIKHALFEEFPTRNELMLTRITIGAFFYLTYTLAYALDSYEANIPEMLIAMNIGKQSISFGFGFEAIKWITEYGYIKVVGGIFCGILAINNLAVLVFLVFGKSMRKWFAVTWLGKLHKSSI